MNYPYKDLREAMGALEAKGLLKHVKAEVDKNWELSAAMRWVYQGYTEANRYAVQFDKVKGYDIPVVVGVLGASYKSYAVCLGIDPQKPRAEVMQEIRQKWVQAMDNPIEPRIVKTGPCKDNILKGNDINMHRFPVPVWTPEKDANSDKGLGFITSPYHVTRDPDTRVRNVGTYRNMLKEKPNEMGISLGAGSHITAHFHKNEKMGKATEIATVIGADPTIGMTSVTQIPEGVDEFAVSGGLRGAPVELVRCETVDLEVPATAEIVIEGKLQPKSVRPYESEGPFGEATGYQGLASLGPVYEITCITHRNNPIYQAFISQIPPSESSKIRHISYEAMVLRQLELIGITGIIDINMPETTQTAITIISIKKSDFTHPARVANALFSILQPRWGKFIIVVDDDIDVYDLDNVFWAISFRTAQTPTRKAIHFYEGLTTNTIDYSAASSFEEALERKAKRGKWPASGILIDATRPFIPYPTISLPPSKYLERARDNWKKYELPKLERDELPKSIVMEDKYYLKEGIADSGLSRKIPR